ncbi:MAG: hypothetical protein LBJ00_16540 [Planctomycetaceae bacterium]|jgi:tetratricopeptide (TPR) repeat protein|nr:hypothetical protein [Planctomycetaceae bacterium]
MFAKLNTLLFFVSFISTTFFVLFFLLASDSSTDDVDKYSGDPLFILYKAYLEDVEKKGKADMVWVDRFLAAASTNSSSHGRLIILYEALGISNSSGEFEKSKSITKLITKIQPDESKKILMIGELGEIEREQCFIEKQNNDLQKSRLHAKNSVENFIKYKDVVSKIPVSPNGVLKQRYLMYASMGGQLARNDLRDQQTALLFYNTALEMIRQNPNLPDGEFSVGLGYDADYFLFNKAKALVEFEKYEEAKQVMDEYGSNSKLSSSGLPRSVYALEFILHALVVKNKDLSDYLERWIQTKPRDSKTFACILCVARKRLENCDIDIAQKYYEEVRTNYWDAVLKSSVTELLQQDGGYISQTLGDLSDIYLSKGERKRSEECQTELRKLLPKYDENKQRVRVLIPDNRDEYLTAPPKNTHEIIIVIVVNAVLIVIILYLVGKKRFHRKR